MQICEKVKFLKPTGTYLHIAPEDPLGPAFYECEVFLRKIFFKALAVPSLKCLCQIRASFPHYVSRFTHLISNIDCKCMHFLDVIKTGMRFSITFALE